jgi:hypothetical protein
MYAFSVDVGAVQSDDEIAIADAAFGGASAVDYVDDDGGALLSGAFSL